MFKLDTTRYSIAIQSFSKTLTCEASIALAAGRRPCRKLSTLESRWAIRVITARGELGLSNGVRPFSLTRSFCTEVLCGRAFGGHSKDCSFREELPVLVIAHLRKVDPSGTLLPKGTPWCPSGWKREDGRHPCPCKDEASCDQMATDEGSATSHAKEDHNAFLGYPYADLEP